MFPRDQSEALTKKKILLLAVEEVSTTSVSCHFRIAGFSDCHVFSQPALSDWECFVVTCLSSTIVYWVCWGQGLQRICIFVYTSPEQENFMWIYSRDKIAV